MLPFLKRPGIINESKTIGDFAVENIEMYVQKTTDNIAVTGKNRSNTDKHNPVSLKKIDFSPIVGEGPQIRQVLNIIRRVVQKKWQTILVYGENGVGKELIARAIHTNSFKTFHPFASINCGDIPKAQMEARLFGGREPLVVAAGTEQKTLFEKVGSGTIFFDEICELDSAIQLKLLNVLKSKVIPTRDHRQKTALKTRIISSCSKDLSKEFALGRLLKDLYYELSVVLIQLPPLRERGEDILLLAKHFLNRYAIECESPARQLTPKAEKILYAYSWPENVRELRQVIERVVLLADGPLISPELLEESLSAQKNLAQTQPSDHFTIEVPPEGMSLEDGEKQLIRSVLTLYRWNKRRASQVLKISRPRLDRKIAKYCLKRK